MKVTLSGKQVDVSDKLRKHVEEGLETSVAKYFSAPFSCSIAFSKEGEDFGAEITVHPTKNIVLKGSGTASDPYSAFDNANEHVATRLRRHKTKLNAHKSKVGLAELAYAAVLPIVEEDEEIDVNEDAPLTIAETDANIPVCTVSEAVMFMDLSNECALMFRNSANNHISMVYRRKDGNIGWVEPKSDN
ncbi:MAG: ribosome-associated translation inhibitor RaiA [Alphaproteobacteria bacterium]|nr:ribosome-associated translation inhibitor RaiA [Alphaproteobacteria bacterium]